MTDPSDHRSDAALVAAVADGDRTALRALYERHEAWLAARLRRRGASSDAVVEVVQDTFVAVWKGASRYDARGEVAAWIWGIGVRRYIGYVRRTPRVLPLLREFMPETAARVISAEDQVLLGVDHGDLAGALDRLSPELREVVQATVLDGLTSREAGRLLGIPAGTVKTRMMRARIQLRGDLA